MKADVPPTITQLLEIAATNGFAIHQHVGSGLMPVFSVDGEEDVIRFFQPEVQTRPWGNQLSGCLGLALRRGVTYPNAICHHALNYVDFVRADRTVDDPAKFEALLKILRRHLEDLPATRADIMAYAADKNTWLGKFAGWATPHALEFIAQVGTPGPD